MIYPQVTTADLKFPAQHADQAASRGVTDQVGDDAPRARLARNAPPELTGDHDRDQTAIDAYEAYTRRIAVLGKLRRLTFISDALLAACLLSSIAATLLTR